MRKRLVFVLGFSLSVLLVASVLIGFGFVDVSKLSLFGAPPGVQPASSTADVFVDPAAIVKDYVNEPGYQIGDRFVVHVNVSGLTDELFTWQVNLTWNKAVLNVSRIVAGDFLGATRETSSEVLGSVINVTDNVDGCAAFAETVLGDVPGVSGDGRLVSVEFLIVGYGWTELTISSTGSLPTKLLSSGGASIAFTVTNGWFDNRITGDSDGNGVVSIADMGEVSDRWTSPPGVKPYGRFVDWDDNGLITISDVGIVSDNWGRSKP